MLAFRFGYVLCLCCINKSIFMYLTPVLPLPNYVVTRLTNIMYTIAILTNRFYTFKSSCHHIDPWSYFNDPRDEIFFIHQRSLVNIAVYASYKKKSKETYEGIVEAKCQDHHVLSLSLCKFCRCMLQNKTKIWTE